MPPALVIVCGAPGAGKSALARWLAPRLRAAYLDKDELNDAFSPTLRDGAFYDEVVRPVTYRALWRLAEANLRLGTSVVVEAPLLRELDDGSWRAERVAQAEAAGARLIALQACVPEPLLRERLVARAFPRDEGRVRDDAAWRAFVDGTRACEPRHWPGVLHTVPMAEGVEGQQAQQALAHAGLSGPFPR